MNKYLIAGAVVAYTGTVALGIYAKLWESIQPEKTHNTFVTEIEPYSSRNDIPLSSSGIRLHLKGEQEPIIFSSSNWDETVQEGDFVSAVSKERFPLFGGLEGIQITDFE